MLPDIGIIVGAYVITRMWVLMGDSTGKIVPRILAGITILVTIVCILDLISTGFKASGALPRL